METEKENPFNVEDVNRLIRTRRSVFTNQFVPGKTIPDNIILQLLENANWAPTHKKTEPWRFMVFTAQGLSRLAAYQAKQYRNQAGSKFKQEKWDKLQRTPMECSHVIALGMKRHLESNIPEQEEMAAVACAVQNIYLSMTAYGLGGYWSTGGVTYDPNAKPFFGLGENDKLMGFFYLGYVQIPSLQGTRKPVDEKITWIRE